MFALSAVSNSGHLGLPLKSHSGFYGFLEKQNQKDCINMTFRHSVV